MFRRSLKLPLALALSVFPLAACEEGEGPVSSGGASQLTVQITDAPGDLSEANVKIEKIVLIREESGEGAGSSRVELTPKSTSWINLLTLDNGKVQDLVTQPIESGTYRQVRLIVCEMYIKTKSGQIVATSGTTLPTGVTVTAGTELKLNSQCKNGFKVNFAEGGVTVGTGTNTMVIDFDVQRSFAHQAGKSGKWIVSPTLHGVRKERGATISGNVVLQGVTLPVTCGGAALTQTALLERVVPTATAGTIVRSGSTKGTGSYTISHLAPGSYTLGVDSVTFGNGNKLRFTAAATPASVTVTSGGTASSNYTISAVTCTTA
ncbi:MAG: DUF4382 domain-containing protein [Gemmatimonadetes bacterium]|nr:DUF4382 domain-containing protein [Gemmatimonadota bacterium]